MILVDTSLWIDYFKGLESALPLNALIELNSICTNDLILAELAPSIKFRKENDLIHLLESIERIPMDIEWQEIAAFQVYNLQNGINNVGIPDLIIAQNAIQNDMEIFARDRHFSLMKKHLGLRVFEP